MKGKILFRAFGALIVSLALVAGLTGCGSDSSEKDAAPSLAVTNAVIPEAAGANTALYFDMTNDGDAADQLIEVKTDLAVDVEIHRSFQDDDGLMQMEAIDKVEIEAGATVSFEPGGFHVMLMGVDDLTEGETVPVELVFAQTGQMSVDAQVTTYADVAG